MYNNLGIVLEDLQRVDEAAGSYKQAVDHQKVVTNFIEVIEVAAGGDHLGRRHR